MRLCHDGMPQAPTFQKGLKPKYQNIFCNFASAINTMDNIINHTSHSLESFSFEALTQCISTIHSALQTSAVNAVNRYATIRNWLIGRYIVEYEQCGND